jgi:putative effector of murein hydrolase
MRPTSHGLQVHLVSKTRAMTRLSVSLICSVVTTLINYTGCFLFAMGSSKLEERFRGLRKRAEDIESQPQSTQPVQNSSLYAKRVYSVEKLTIVMENNGSVPSFETPCPPSVTMEFVVRTAPMWISILLTITVGLPVYCATGYDMPFESLFLIFLWVGTVLVQRWVKLCKTLGLHPRTKSMMMIVINPVLMTSVLATAYFWAKATVTHRDIANVLGAFKHYNTWADVLTETIKDPRPQNYIGAGDMSIALLDAGIVSLGFKMFEYRRELWKSFTTVFSTSLIFATMNIFLNVIFARAMGLEPFEALGFAARNVTIALGVPAIQNLQGSTTLMSALVVFSGILFSLTGDMLFSLLGICDRPLPPNITYNSDSEVSGLTVIEDRETEPSDCKVIAGGVTVGINAAAMGTAYLIERDSMATAYSALSMTMFGTFTVALSAVPAVPDVLMKLASR